MPASDTPVIFEDIASAKVNLTLHIGRAIADRADPFYRYHPLDSLVVFAGICDHLSMTPSDDTSLVLSGPFADDLKFERDNIILRAMAAVARETSIPPLQFHLVKNLPVAAGIGGGSANAAAALRLIQRFLDNQDPDEDALDWMKIALSLGADVPVCFNNQTARMTGIGDSITLAPNLGQVYGLLVNPGIAVSTRTIFENFDLSEPQATPRPQEMKATLLETASLGHNDLEAITCEYAPIIRDVLSLMSRQAGCQLTRMSGSGATCFGIFDTRKSAHQAQKNIQSAQPAWWCQATTFGDAAQGTGLV